ncbi:MAG TPA: GNAT family N-acetyltransferase [Anaerolineales bacterium]|nr:GNAT family N-acetyltransferase [Anaerolineales bacterium]
MTEISLRIQVVDPRNADALTLLHEAAMEARELYPELHDPNAPLPTNPPTPERGIYLLVYDGSQPVGSGGLRPIDESTVEICRIYVLKEYRRHGVARMILEALEREAARLQCTRMRLETGNRQTAAMRLYESFGFSQIPPFGMYVDDPISVCYEKPVQVK